MSSAVRTVFLSGRLEVLIEQQWKPSETVIIKVGRTLVCVKKVWPRVRGSAVLWQAFKGRFVKPGGLSSEC